MYNYYSDVGGRENNEDSFLAIESEGALLLVVADGLGGHECGEVASGIAVEELRKLFLRSPKHFDIEQAIIKANASILKRQETTNKKMKTTVSAAYIYGAKTVVANVGDSRLYLLKDNKIVFRTTDHSAAQMAVQAGEITEDQIRIYPDRNMLTRALGSTDSVKVDIYKIDSDSYDRLLTCSDGLWEHILEKDITDTAEQNANPEEWIKAMRAIHDINAPKGCDNNTAVVLIKSQNNAVPVLNSKGEKKLSNFFLSGKGIFLLSVFTVLLLAIIVMASAGLFSKNKSNNISKQSPGVIVTDIVSQTVFFQTADKSNELEETPFVVNTDVQTTIPSETTFDTPSAELSPSPAPSDDNLSTITPATQLVTDTPTDIPTTQPTESPTSTPTKQPTESPTITPTKQPTATPTASPRITPTKQPTVTPSETSAKPAPTKQDDVSPSPEESIIPEPITEGEPKESQDPVDDSNDT